MNKIKKILFLLLLFYWGISIFKDTTYLVSLGDTPIYLNSTDILDNLKSPYRLKKGDVVTVKGIIDLKHYLAYKVIINGEIRYILEGDYIIIDNSFWRVLDN